MNIPREPTTNMLRALLVHRGYDPDAKEQTLDKLGQLDLLTMGRFIEAWKVMWDAAARNEASD